MAAQPPERVRLEDGREAVLESNHDVVALLRKVGPVEAQQPGGGVARLCIAVAGDDPCPAVVRESPRAAAPGDLTPA